jgi:cytochrome c-type biogenesis protein CcmF
VPAKFIYKSMGGQASTEIARHITPRDDLYVTLAMANPQTKAATFQFHVNPLVSLILLGAALMVLGALVSLWPDVREQESRSFGYVRLGAGFATTLLFAGALVLWPGSIPRAATIDAAEHAWLDPVPVTSLAAPSTP